MKDVTIPEARQRLAVQATYELEALANLFLRLAGADDQLDKDLVRGLALRTRDLVQVVMSTLDNDVDEAHARRTVLGEVFADETT